MMSDVVLSVCSVYRADGEDVSRQWLFDQLLTPAGSLQLSSGW